MFDTLMVYLWYMHVTKNKILAGKHGRPVVTDIFFSYDGRKKPVVIYAHGINGFKDWGNFDLVARQFAIAGFTFIKFNFSHNGTTAEQPEDFVDLEAYAQDNYTIQLDDLETVIDWVTDSANEYNDAIDTDKIYLLGHSKGGGMVLLKAAEDVRIRAVVTWAAVSQCKTPWATWDEQKIKDWETTGVQHLTNGRTKQQMPLYYQLYRNYIDNATRLNIQEAISTLRIPILICHGTEDPAVDIQQAYQLHHWQPNAVLFTVESDHVFGRKHPWTQEHLPKPMQEVVDKTINFLKAI